MLKESGRVVAVDNDGLWVETLKTSSCAKCVAKSGCGQNLAARLTPSHNMTLIKAFFQQKVMLDNDLVSEGAFKESHSWQVGDTAIIGVAEKALLMAAIFAYGVPLLLMIVGLMLSQWLPLSHESSDLHSALGALMGLLIGGGVVHWWSKAKRNDGLFQAHVLSHAIATDASSTHP